MTASPETPGGRRWLRIGILLAGYALLMVLGHYGGRWLEEQLGGDASLFTGSGVLIAVGAALVVYVVLLALPFVPGMEISLALFAVFGARIAVPIYLATLVALLISYLAGRLMALRSLSGLFDFLGLRAGGDLVRRLAPLPPHERIDLLVETAPSRLVPVLVRYRELALVAALNLPGNVLIGGGGGIALLAGMCGLFSLPRYILAVAAASAPIPLAIMLAGEVWR